MNWPYWIASKVSVGSGSSFTTLIVRLGIGTVALCLCVLLLTSFLIRGFQQEITDKVFNFWGHIHITHVTSDRSMDAVPIDDELAVFDSIASTEHIQYLTAKGKPAKSYGGVRMLFPFIHYPGILSTKDEFDGVICRGVSDNYDWTTYREYIVDGDILHRDSAAFHQQILISQIQANRLKISVGEDVLLNFIKDGRQIKRRMHVVGIYDTGLAEYDERFVLIDMALLQDLLGWASNQASGIAVMLDDIRDLDVINEYIYLEQLPPELYSESIRSKYPGIFEWLDLQKVNEYVLLIIMLVVAFFNLSTVLIVLILERARMIGVMKSLGAGNWGISQIFLSMMGRIILYGFIFGNLLAFTIAWCQDRFHFIKLNQEDYYLSYAPIDIDWSRVVILNLFTFIVVLLFMLIPARVIAGIKPIKVLSFD